MGTLLEVFKKKNSMINLLVAVGSFKYLNHGEENGGQMLFTHVKENTLILEDFSFALH